MGRYRKIEVRMWGDEKFRALSPVPACGQGLWFFLLTGPHTLSIPGLSTVGRAAMAEQLKWSQEAFDKAFGEAVAQGMVKADWEARVVWVPNGIKHNKPESPNVVLSWGDQFDLIPECALKHEAYEALKISVYALGEAYEKAFDKGFGKPSLKPSLKPSTKPMPYQEQEQEKTPAVKSSLAKQGSAPPKTDPIPQTGNSGSNIGGAFNATDAAWALCKEQGWTGTKIPVALAAAITHLAASQKSADCVAIGTDLVGRWHQHKHSGAKFPEDIATFFSGAHYQSYSAPRKPVNPAEAFKEQVASQQLALNAKSRL